MSAQDELAVTAQRRFGLGISPGGDIASGDPRGNVLAQLEGNVYTDRSGLPPSDEILRQLRAWQEKVRENRDASNGDKTIQRAKNAFVRDEYLNEAQYRQSQAIQAERPLIERLTWFWSAHFCVSCAKGEHVRAIAGAYEREAIRPFVTGRFRDMLGAVMHHPAMLVYLDNASSFGPNSKAGLRQKKGLNENLGREMMELHTVGVKAGYSQADVTNASRIITGWGIANEKQPDGGRFRFYPQRHEPGTFTVMGLAFADDGEAQGDALLDMLAEHPATARHIAGKLVRHFVGDHAPPDLVPVVAQAFQDSGGDLGETMAALVRQPRAWSTPPAKVIPPYDMSIAAQRLTGLTMDVKPLVNFGRLLGQPLWTPRSPNGFPDGDMAWAAPNSLVKRFDYALQFSRRIRDREPMELAGAAFGAAMRPDLTTAIKRAASRPEAFATILMSPEMQLR